METIMNQQSCIQLKHDWSQVDDVYVDIETDGLLEENKAKNQKEVTKIHCIVLRDVSAGTPGDWPSFPMLSCADQPGYVPLAEAIRVLRRAKKLYGHNILRYDIPVLNRLVGDFPWEEYVPRIRDSLQICGLRWTDLADKDVKLIHNGTLPPKCRGKNTLKAWGYRLGIHKGDYADEGEDREDRWESWSPEMQTYCEQDTNVGLALVFHLKAHLGGYKEAVETELELAWYLAEQENNGWPFDFEKGTDLYEQLNAKRAVLERDLKAKFGWRYRANGKPVVPKKDRTMKPKKDAKVQVPARYFKDAEYVNLKQVEFNPNSHAQIAGRLIELGWIPTKFTPKGQPETNEEALETCNVNIPEVAMLVEYLLLQKRIGQLAEGEAAWLKLAKPTGRYGGKLTGLQHVHGAMKQGGTITHRASHFGPNLGQVPKNTAPYGVECRGLFKVPKGWVELGVDEDGQQLRMLGHYLAPYDDGKFANAMARGDKKLGTDAHSLNRDALGLTGDKGRDDAKTFIYTFLFGGGPLKLGMRVPPTDEQVEAYKKKQGAWNAMKKRLSKDGGNPDDYTIACAVHGATLKARFLKNFPALVDLMDAVGAKAKKCGYLIGLDGRRIPIRRSHAALNSLLMAGEAVCSKRWIVHLARRLRAKYGKPGWGGKWAQLGWIHDEIQIAVHPDIAEDVKQMACEEIEKLEQHFKLKCPLKGEGKIGPDWAACH